MVVQTWGLGADLRRLCSLDFKLPQFRQIVRSLAGNQAAGGKGSIPLFPAPDVFGDNGDFRRTEFGCRVKGRVTGNGAGDFSLVGSPGVAGGEEAEVKNIECRGRESNPHEV